VSNADFVQSHRGSFVVIVLAAFVIVCAGIRMAAPILVPIVLGGFIATANIPLVIWLYRRRMPLVLTVATSLVADAVVLGGFSSLLVSSVTRLMDRLPAYLSRLETAEAHVSVWLRSHGVETRVYEIVDPAAVVGLITALAGDAAGGLADLVLALIIAAFLLFRFAKPGPGDSGGRVLRTQRVRRAVREMYRYIAIKTLTSMATGALVGFWLWVIDADLPVLFGLVAFLLNYIPTLGSVVAGVVVSGVGLLQHGVEHAGLIALGYVVINMIIGNVIEPRVMGRALGLWPLVVLLSVVFWGWLLGIIGAVLSSLLTQAVKVMLLSTPDLRLIGLVLGPVPRAPARRESHADLLEEAMPPSGRPRPPAA
jgi:predicted PurR-regulated permease PerM